MQIAVAGVKDVGDAQAVFLRQLPHARQHLRQLGARDGAVHAVIVGRDAADRRERRLAAGPEQQPLLLRGGDPAGDGAARLGDGLDALDQMIDLGLRAVELDDQQRLDIERIAGMDEFLDRVDRRPVHHLHAAGNDAGADDRRTQSPASSDDGKPTSTARCVSAFFRMRTVTSVTTPSRPSEPVMMPEQIVAAGIEMLAAERRTSPFISTISQPSTLLVVMPYFRQCTPPEFSATLPPMVQAICEDGSGA